MPHARPHEEIFTLRIGILTSGGDCPALNAVIRGVAKYCYANIPKMEILGIADGYGGLINNEYKKMEEREFSGILNLGGTILGTSRQPFKEMLTEENKTNKIEKMVSNYKKMKLDAVVILGGAGTHKSAALLSAAGLNVVALPKTIDNDIYGTDFTFGFFSAVDVATQAIDRVHTTAASHGRTMLVEIMGNKVGWLTLYAGLAGGADVILLPEMPFNTKTVCDFIAARNSKGKAFSIIAIAEGAIEKSEVDLGKKERIAVRAERGDITATAALAKNITARVGVETRIVVPGHTQRGGSPSAYDRVISTEVGAYAGYLIKEKIFGVTVALKGDKITYNKLIDIAGKTKSVEVDNPLVVAAKNIGICFGC